MKLAVTTSGVVTQTVLGAYTITYTATDNNSNTTTRYRTVVVADRDAPLITLKHANQNPYTVSQHLTNQYVDLGYEVQDNYDPTQNINVIYNSDNVTMSELGTYSISYHAIDTSGNISNTV